MSPEFSVAFLHLHSTLYLGPGAFLGGNGKQLHASYPESGLTFHRLFLTEGIATVIFGVAIWFLLPDCKRPWFCPFHNEISYLPVANSKNVT